MAMIPVLRPILTDLQARKRTLDRARADLSGIGPAMRSNGGGARAHELEREIEGLVVEVQSLINRVRELGVELKDIDAGLVDFPSLREGRVVYLCWLASEGSIDYWHDLEAGFAGRQPL